jgi:3-hydroxyisobutyrate dehydrogenase-like beta-hydroxyacid dehydrogenase
MDTEKIGFIGLGNMGHPMAKNLERRVFHSMFLIDFRKSG